VVLCLHLKQRGTIFALSIFLNRSFPDKSPELKRHVMRKNFFANHVGFTLIEILIVVAIISILSGIAIPYMFKALDLSKDKRVLTDMRNFAVAIGLYQVDLGVVPQADNIYDLIDMLQMFQQAQAAPLKTHDVWGYEFYYYGSDQDYTLKSRGKDGQWGNPATTAYFDAKADTIIISGMFVACHEGATVVVQ